MIWTLIQLYSILNVFPQQLVAMIDGKTNWTIKITMSKPIWLWLLTLLLIINRCLCFSILLLRAMLTIYSCLWIFINACVVLTCIALARYPPPDKQLAMAVDIVRTFPLRACKAGKGHVSLPFLIVWILYFTVIWHVSVWYLDVAVYELTLSAWWGSNSNQFFMLMVCLRDWQWFV